MNLFVYFLAGLISGLFSCPTPFTGKKPYCFHQSASGFTYCDAQNYCHNLGGELINGKTNFETAKTIYKDTNVWLGLNDFVNERKKNRSGYQWANGEIADSYIWDPREPGNYKNQDCCILNSKSRLEDKYCSNIYKALCQYRLDAEKCVTFARKSVLTFTDPERYATHPCQKEISDVHSKEDCLKKCFFVVNSACKTIFYNSIRKICLLVFYNDASVKLLSPEMWKKFTSIIP